MQSHMSNVTHRHEGSLFAKLHDSKAKGDKVLQAHGITPKVMETWLNDILKEAEHLDIPGVVLKPEHKVPITRYGIDRMDLTNAGVPNEMVDRIYRCMYVHSVGFHSMI